MSLKHALLGLLADGPASGYDLLRTFRSSLSNVWPATQSQVYTDLGRLDAAGHIRVVEEGPRGRKTYAITDTGREELRHWMVQVPPDGQRRNDMLLRVFLLGTVEPDEARTYLRRRAEVAAERHAEYAAMDSATEWDDGPLSLYGRLALEWAKRFTAMSQEWSVWALAEFEKAEEKRKG
ncbi:PadR family transcriptional regulator [Streptomyces sp. NPDC002004]